MLAEQLIDQMMAYERADEYLRDLVGSFIDPSKLVHHGKTATISLNAKDLATVNLKGLVAKLRSHPDVQTVAVRSKPGLNYAVVRIIFRR